MAPSFPAEFVDIPPGTLVAMIRALGFDSVHEVSLGADLVAQAYNRLLEENPDKRYITTPCPAVVSYVRKYHSRLMPNLAPLVSPMVAMARVLRHELGEDLKTVFMGPCVAKKRASIDVTHHEFDAVLTFAELRDMFEKRGIKPESFSADDDFDPPYGGVGMVFPIPGGLLQTAEMNEDLLTGDVIVADGRDEFVETISEFDDSHAGTRLLDVLACQGCYAGAGMTSDITMLQRRGLVSTYARTGWPNSAEEQLAELAAAKEKYSDIDLSREHLADEQTLGDSATAEELEEILHRMGKFKAEDLLNCGACGYEGCLEHARAVYAGLADSEMCLPHTIEQLRSAYERAWRSRTARSKRPRRPWSDRANWPAWANSPPASPTRSTTRWAPCCCTPTCSSKSAKSESQIKDDLETIVDQANRCKRIISGLLNFARQSRVLRQPTDVAELVEKTIRTAPDVSNVRVTVDNRLADPVADIDPDQMIQVLTNLYTNAQQAMPEGGDLTITLTRRPRDHHHQGDGHRRGRTAGEHAQAVRPVLHHQAGGHGHRARAGRHPRHRQDAQGADLGGVERRQVGGPTGTTFTVTLPRHE